MILIIILNEKEKIVLVQNEYSIEDAKPYKDHFLLKGTKDFTFIVFDNDKGEEIERIKKNS